MSGTFSVDLISDLNLSADDEFVWEGKATSLFCVIAGGISQDLEVVRSTLDHLSNYYRGIMYIDGSLEHENLGDYTNRIDAIRKICEPFTNIIYLHNHVVILNSIAFVGCNAWFYNNPSVQGVEDLMRVDDYKIDDLGYLSKTLKSLQTHHDAKKIVVITSSAPSEHLFYRSQNIVDKTEPALALIMDTEHKVDAWLYGGTNVNSDSVINNRRFVNNPKIPGQPYWPKTVLL